MIKSIITRELLASLPFRVMTDSDRNGFDGLDSPVPLIAETSDGKHLVVIDGDYCEVYTDQEDGSFELTARCLSIRALPMPQY